MLPLPLIIKSVINIKSYYDLDKREQIELKNEFRKKWGEYIKLLGASVCGLILGVSVDYMFDMGEDSIMFIIPYIIAAIPVIIVSIMESIEFKDWLKTRGIIK